MDQTHDIFYDTYSLLLKQGFIFDKAVLQQDILENTLTISKGQFDSFVQLHFEEVKINYPVIGCSIRFIKNEADLLTLLEGSEHVYLKVLYGSAGITIGDKAGSGAGAKYLLTGDGYVPSNGANYRVTYTDGMLVLARLELSAGQRQLAI
ncbi:hypothetical protein H8S90_08620 [Olivibacter sp. SDN3]|uniref:hypothetical protein n=1 Tax=Olivibacter sp. SDN3 TaxID=2764720 RepID=UPI0016511704|nr:hypothetical protein [Olivibacter sp. SDN3]QNL51619.1 hypothetical protein H8S90_08620 [Olivibacter sp. SDN3]